MEKILPNFRIPKSKAGVKGFTPAEKIPAKRGWYFRVAKKWWLNDLAKLSPAERCVLITLKLHDNPRLGCFPSTRTLARELHVSTNLILRAIKKLKKKGFLKVDVRGRRSNSYNLKKD